MAELSVSRKSIKELLSLSDTNSKGKMYIIPEYQRPYRWDKEKCETLWIDLTNFYEETKQNKDENREYFLGTIVTCLDSDNTKNIDVIDGQQRITTLFLLLRAFYTKLEEMKLKFPDDEDIIGLMSSIEPCIWNVNPMSKKVTDKGSIHIYSLVATDKDNDIFHGILKDGKVPESKQSNYAINYEFFIQKYNEYIQTAPKHWKELCLSIIERCIVLPIECEDLDSALTIFGTLNDRGLPLSDSDIFKAELYKQQTTQKEKDAFTKAWKELEETVEEGRFSLDALFRYYTHIIRGRKEDKSKEIGLRRFYAGSENKYKLFKEVGFFENLQGLAGFWKELGVRNEDFKEENSTYCNLEAKKYVHCLNCYPNDYWKYTTSVFYHVHKDDPEFKTNFSEFLKRLMSYLFVRFVESPTVNTIKDPTFAFCVEISKTGNVDFSYPIPKDFKQTLSLYNSSKISKPMILLEAYLYDEGQRLLPENFEIEHIFPQKWQDTNYNGWTQEEAKKHLNLFGNKVAIEKKLNIQAGNGYFGQKKPKYSTSTISEVRGLGQHERNDWTKDDIEKRDEVVLNTLETFFKDTIEKAQKQTVLCEIKEGREMVCIKRVDDGDSTVFVMDAMFEDAANASVQDVLNNSIPIREVHQTSPSMDVIVSYVPKEFMKKHIDEFQQLLLTAY